MKLIINIIFKEKNETFDFLLLLFPLIDWWLIFVKEDGWFNVGCERRRWDFELFVRLGEADVLSNVVFEEICIGCEII